MLRGLNVSLFKDFVSQVSAVYLLLVKNLRIVFRSEMNYTITILSNFLLIGILTIFLLAANFVVC